MAMTKTQVIEKFIKEATLTELDELINSASEARESKEEEALIEARAEIEAVAEAKGFSMALLYGGKKGNLKVRAPAKFRNPEDAKATWSGKGAQPKWYKEALAGGKVKEDLLINKG